MDTVIEALRKIIGEPEFYTRLTGSTSNYSWDYGAMLEYAVASMVVLVVVSSVFKCLRGFFGR